VAAACAVTQPRGQATSSVGTPRPGQRRLLLIGVRNTALGLEDLDRAAGSRSGGRGAADGGCRNDRGRVRHQMLLADWMRHRSGRVVGVALERVDLLGPRLVAVGLAGIHAVGRGMHVGIAAAIMNGEDDERPALVGVAVILCASFDLALQSLGKMSEHERLAFNDKEPCPSSYVVAKEIRRLRVLALRGSFVGDILWQLDDAGLDILSVSGPLYSRGQKHRTQQSEPFGT